MTSAVDRRLAVRNFISEKRHTSVRELMHEFGVSKSTILRDLDAITDCSSFYTECGRSGGIHAMDGWYASRNYLTASQEGFLKQIRNGLQTEEEVKMMDSILSAFAMPHQQ